VRLQGCLQVYLQHNEKGWNEKGFNEKGWNEKGRKPFTRFARGILFFNLIEEIASQSG
jgi:hypothetical protein